MQWETIIWISHKHLFIIVCVFGVEHLNGLIVNLRLRTVFIS